MKIIGLSGGVASGKNFIAEIFAKKNAAIFDADAEVHKLLSADATTIREVVKKFPASFINKKIDRKTLGKIVFSDEKKLHILEKIIHPKVRKNYLEFLKAAKKSKKDLVVLNIPLLLETNSYKCDYTVAITAPVAVRKKRFLLRSKAKSATEKKYSAKKFEQIRENQISDLERKKRADFVVNNGLSKANSEKQVKKILASILPQ